MIELDGLKERLEWYGQFFSGCEPKEIYYWLEGAMEMLEKELHLSDMGKARSAALNVASVALAIADKIKPETGVDGAR